MIIATRDIATDPKKYDMVRHGNLRDIVVKVKNNIVTVISFNGDDFYGQSCYMIGGWPSWSDWYKTRDNK